MDLKFAGVCFVCEGVVGGGGHPGGSGGRPLCRADRPGSPSPQSASVSRPAQHPDGAHTGRNEDPKWNLNLITTGIFHSINSTCNVTTMYLNPQSSILSLLAVAADRYVAILMPFQYQRVMSPRNARLALLLTWMLSAITGTVPLMDWQRQPADSE